jgi:hypothetical protein
MDEIAKPPAEPTSQGDMYMHLAVLKPQLQEQCSQRLELPSEFVELMSITNGIEGTGLPRETAYTMLVYALRGHGFERGRFERASSWVRIRDFTVLAAWDIGSCIQHRQIYYMLRYEANRESAGHAKWRILANSGPRCSEMYESLAEFFRHETESFERRAGVAKTEQATYLSQYSGGTSIY